MLSATLLFFNFGGDLPLMDFNFWWSFPSGGVILHAASALHSGGGFSLTTAAVLTLSAVVERWVLASSSSQSYTAQ